MLKQLIVVGAFALSAASAFAGEYRTIQVASSKGGLVQLYIPETTKAPYALTGRAEQPTQLRVENRWAGTHFVGPSYVAK